MANIIITHGTGGSPDGNWFPWLKAELEKIGHRVFVPMLPTPKDQSLDNWLNVFKGYERYLDENTVVVGHSLGAAFLLTVIEKLDRPIKAAYFIAGFIGLIGNAEFDELNKTFTTKDFDWVKIKRNCKRFYVIGSDNDPYVKSEKGVELAGNLGAEHIVLENAGHINEDAGYVKFDLLLELIKKETI